MSDDENESISAQSEDVPGSVPQATRKTNDTTRTEDDAPIQERAKKAFVFSVQDYLSLGYIYLLLLGIITQVIFYRLIGINILYYHGLFDVLLSPVVLMARSTGIFIVFVLCLVVTWFLGQRLKAKRNREQGKKESVSNAVARKVAKTSILTRVFAQPPNSAADSEWKAYVEDNFFVIYSSVLVFFMFIGGGIGAGIRESERLESKEFEPNHVLEFVDESKKNVRIIGQNSQFIFYAVPGFGDVRVAPIEGNIRVIRQFDQQQEAKKELKNAEDATAAKDSSNPNGSADADVEPTKDVPSSGKVN